MDNVALLWDINYYDRNNLYYSSAIKYSLTFVEENKIVFLVAAAWSVELYGIAH